MNDNSNMGASEQVPTGLSSSIEPVPVSPLRASIPSAVLTIPVNGIYFDQIRAGTKTEEYRLCNPYWAKRLEHRRIGRVVLTRGYPKGGGVEGETRLTREWNGFTPKVITHPHFGPEPALVYAIDVSASAIEARQGHDAQRHGAQHESAVAKPDAQTQDIES